MVLETLPSDVLFGRSAIFWIDNISAKYGLQKAYSRMDDSGRIINAFKVKQAAFSLAYLVRVCPLVRSILPTFLRAVCGIVFWRSSMRSLARNGPLFLMSRCFLIFLLGEAPLSVLPKRTRKRHGSRGAKRRRGPASASASAGASVSS